VTYRPDLQFVWRAPSRVTFGPGRLSRLGKEARGLGATRAMLVTDPFMAASGVAGRAADSLRAEGIEVLVFDGVESDPSTEVVDAGVAAAREFDPDLFVGLGGGSAMDAAKLIDLLLVAGGTLADHLTPNSAGALRPIIAIPTTAGTGSETSFAAVISEHASRRKIPLVQAAFTPVLAILDPELTVSLPARLSAATGMDAVAHALDVIHSTRRQPFNDALAHHVLRVARRHLRRAAEDPGDLVARGQMLAAACSMGFSLSTTPYGVIHALAHPLGAHFGLHHGVCVALLSPPGLRWNLATCAPVYAEAARAAGLAADSASDESAAGALVEGIESLLADLGLPRRLTEVGVGAGALAALATDALADTGAAFNLRRPGGAGELEEVYRTVL
jgi:alcohol dehydrogenase class IV